MLAGGAVAALCGFLLYRIAPDVRDKPLYEDEAVAGLIAMRPLGELLDTVMLDRGGAPLHFLLAHAVFWVDTSAEALRWLSVVCAVAAVPLCFDLGRRLGGTAAGLVAAAVVASSTALAVYGSFGRMYALYVLVAALAADLFVRAFRLGTANALAAAAAAAWLLPAVHPYGAIPALVGSVAAALVWRRRAWPFGVAAVAATPFVVADLRLADRSDVGEGGSSLAGPGDAWGELVAAVSSFAGGDGLALLAFTVLAVLGVVVLFRREPAVAVLAISVAVPPVLFMLIPAGSQPDLSPRHLFFGLPLWAAAIGVGAVAVSCRLPSAIAGAVLGLIVLAALASPPSALRDPRELGLLPTEIRADVQGASQDLLIPYATPFLSELGTVTDALALPQGPGEAIVDALEHAEDPVATLYLAVPGQRGWEVATVAGPLARDAAPAIAAGAFANTPHPEELDWWYRLVVRGLCDAAAALGRPCAFSS